MRCCNLKCTCSVSKRSRLCSHLHRRTQSVRPFQSIPEAVVSCIHSNWKRELENLLAWADVVAVGPGIGMEAQKLDILNYVLEHADIPVILDADALNLVARHNLSLDGYSMPVAVTPHLGRWQDCADQPFPIFQRI